MKKQSISMLKMSLSPDGSNILGSGGMFFGGTNLKILEVKSRNSDIYICNATSPGHPPVIARATLDVLSK